MPQSVVCMPSRSTILTGQHPSTHGVWMNGVPLPVDAPSVAEVLHDAGYRTALIGKPHFEPFLDPFARFAENRFARTAAHRRRTHRGLRALRGGHARRHGPAALRPLAGRQPPRGGRACSTRCSTPRSRSTRWAAATPAPRRCTTTRPARVVPHRLGGRPHDRLARLARRRRRLVLLDELPRSAPPVGSAGVGAGPGALARRAAARRLHRPTPPSASGVLDAKPRHWRAWYDGRLVSNYEAPLAWVPATLTADQVREVNARNAVEVELIDEALGRVLAAIAARGWADDVDVDLHHRPRRAAGRLRAAVQGPVPRRRADAAAARLAPGAVGRRRRRPRRHRAGRVWSTWPPRSAPSPASPSPSGWRAGRCPSTTPTPTPAASSGCSPNGTASCSASPCTCARSPATAGCARTYQPGYSHDGTEGELYDLADDPAAAGQPVGRPAVAAVRTDLLADLWDHQPPMRSPKPRVVAPV